MKGKDFTVEVLAEAEVTNMSERGQVVIPKGVRTLLRIGKYGEKTLGYVPIRIKEGEKDYVGSIGILYFPVEVRPKKSP